MRQPAGKRERRGREIIAGAAVALAVAVAAVCVPVLAAREGGGEGGDVVPSLPFLVGLSGLSIGVALLALYRLAVERAARTQAASEAPRDEGIVSLEGISAPSNGDDSEVTPAREAKSEPAPPAVATTAEPRRDDPERRDPAIAALVRAELDRVMEDRRATSAPPPPAEAPQQASPTPSGGRTADRVVGPRPGRRSGKKPVADRPARPERAPAAASQAQDDGESTVTETCEIVWWHGAKRGGFEARMNGDRRRPRVAERSQMIAWTDPLPPPPEGAAADAHEGLVAKLVQQGWQPAEPGETWYGTRFSRSVPNGRASSSR